MPSIQQNLLPLTLLAGLFGCEDKENTVNIAPEISSVPVTPTEGVLTSSLLQCEVVASDPDNDPLDITIEWTDQDGVILVEGSELLLT